LTLSSVLIAPVLIFMALAEGPMSLVFGDVCGDGIGPCHCGDVVVTDTLLGGSDPVLRTRCPCDGLSVASGITLEIVGTIRAEAGNQCSGIRLADHAVVRTGRVTGFDIGVDAAGATGVRIWKLQVSDSGTWGILVEGDDNQVERNIVTRASTGIEVFGTGNEVRLNRTEDTDLFGMIATGHKNIVSRNLILRSGFDGLVILGERFTVDRNKSRANGGSGFSIDGARHSVSLNVAEVNQLDGFTVFAGGSTLTRNHSTGNVDFGILNIGDDNVYAKNLCILNGFVGSDPPGLCF
jgi:hypothetical protein